MFLSPEMDGNLREHVREMGLTTEAKCVFAGMDYHLDWLFAALWLAKKAPDWRPPAPPPAMEVMEENTDLKAQIEAR